MRHLISILACLVLASSALADGYSDGQLIVEDAAAQATADTALELAQSNETDIAVLETSVVTRIETDGTVSSVRTNGAVYLLGAAGAPVPTNLQATLDVGGFATNAIVIGEGTLNIASNYSLLIGKGNIAATYRNFLVGEGNEAYQKENIIVGKDNIARNGRTLLVGSGNTTFGANSLAGGSGSIASNLYSLAFGSLAKALGQGSWAGGDRSIASNEWSLAFGDQCISGGDQAVSLGRLSKALGFGSFAWGSGSEANGIASVVFGSSCTAAGEAGYAMGFSADANHDQSFVLSKSAAGAVSDAQYQIKLKADGGIAFEGDTTIDGSNVIGLIDAHEIRLAHGISVVGAYDCSTNDGGWMLIGDEFVYTNEHVQDHDLYFEGERSAFGGPPPTSAHRFLTNGALAYETTNGTALVGFFPWPEVQPYVDLSLGVYTCRFESFSAKQAPVVGSNCYRNFRVGIQSVP